MDFEPTEEQCGLRDASRQLLARDASATRTREVSESGNGFDRELWRRGAELGWPSLALPEEVGGLGQELVDLVLVAIEHGRAVLPSPFIPTTVAADALVAAKAHPSVVEMLASGEQTASWAGAEADDACGDALPSTQARAVEGGYRISGHKVTVQDARSADWLLVDATLAGERARFLCPTRADGVVVRRITALDVTRELDDVDLVDVALNADSLVCAGADADAGAARSHARTTVLICAELVGVGERLLEMTVDYAGHRVQFGRPIGSFQAVKHKCATMRVELQASRAATLYAAMSVEAGTNDADAAVSTAKAYVSDAITHLAGEALQIHGGIGFTWEHDLHLYLRRAKSNALLYGSAAYHRERLCRLVETDGIRGHPDDAAPFSPV